MDKTPLYRRPSWAKTQVSYEAAMKSEHGRTRSPNTSNDFGVENFSYDDKYLAPFVMPKDLASHDRLPDQLKLFVTNWGCAGAAIDTAIERITKLRAEAVTRGWPDKSQTNHLSRTHWRYTGNSPAISGAESPPLSSPMSPAPALPPALVPLASAPSLTAPELKRPTSAAMPPMPANPPMGMESPPFTPVNSQAPTTPANPADGVRATLPDLSKINTQLTPSATAGAISPSSASTANSSPLLGAVAPSTGTSTPIPPKSSPGPSTTTANAFDENAWETYIRQYRAELTDLQKSALYRFTGHAHNVNTLLREFHGMPEFAEGVKHFQPWWDGIKELTKKYEEKVKATEMPDLEKVKLERAAKGMVV